KAALLAGDGEEEEGVEAAAGGDRLERLREGAGIGEVRGGSETSQPPREPVGPMGIARLQGQMGRRSQEGRIRLPLHGGVELPPGFVEKAEGVERLRPSESSLAEPLARTTSPIGGTRGEPRGGRLGESARGEEAS